jgi:hypothetical protein
VTSARNPEVYRRALASAQERLLSGERAPGAMPGAPLKAELGLSGRSRDWACSTGEPPDQLM